MVYRRAARRSSQSVADQGMRAGIAPAPSALEQTIDNRINAPLVALARLLGAQAARESLKAGADVAVAESSGGVDA